MISTVKSDSGLVEICPQQSIQVRHWDMRQDLAAALNRTDDSSNRDPFIKVRVEPKSNTEASAVRPGTLVHTAIPGYAFKEELEPLGGSTILAHSRDGH